MFRGRPRIRRMVAAKVASEVASVALVKFSCSCGKRRAMVLGHRSAMLRAQAKGDGRHESTRVASSSDAGAASNRGRARSDASAEVPAGQEQGSRQIRLLSAKGGGEVCCHE